MGHIPAETTVPLLETVCGKHLTWNLCHALSTCFFAWYLLQINSFLALLKMNAKITLLVSWMSKWCWCVALTCLIVFFLGNLNVTIVSEMSLEMDFDGCAPSSQPSVSYHPTARYAKHHKTKSQKLLDKRPVPSPNVYGCYPKPTKDKLSQSSTRLAIQVFQLQIFSPARVNLVLAENANQSTTL